MTEPDNPVPSLARLMKERRELWEQMRQAIDGNQHLRPNPENAITIAFFDANLAIDELLATAIISTTEAQKWVSEEVGTLRALVRDVQASEMTRALTSGCG